MSQVIICTMWNGVFHQMARHYFFLTGLFAILSGSLFWTGCSRDSDRGSLDLVLDEVAAGQELVFDTLTYTCAAGHAYSVITLRYYLSRICIRSKAGATIEISDVFYREARKAPVGHVASIDIPNGEYTALEFVFGLDEVMNVDGGLENTIENINMEWPIPGEQGYHYMKFEGKYDVYNTGVVRSFNLHLGATGGNQNYFRVTLPLSSFIVDNNDWQITLAMDVNAWLQGTATYDFETYGPAIMMNQTAQEALRANGASVFTVSSIDQIE